MCEVFRTEAYNRSAIDVITEFSNTYWDRPRNYHLTGTGSLEDDNLIYFQIEDGTATYKCQYVPGVHLVSLPVYRITRL